MRSLMRLPLNLASVCWRATRCFETPPANLAAFATGASSKTHSIIMRRRRASVPTTRLGSPTNFARVASVLLLASLRAGMAKISTLQTTEAMLPTLQYLLNPTCPLHLRTLPLKRNRGASAQTLTRFTYHNLCMRLCGTRGHIIIRIFGMRMAASLLFIQRAMRLVTANTAITSLGGKATLSSVR